MEEEQQLVEFLMINKILVAKTNLLRDTKGGHIVNLHPNYV